MIASRPLRVRCGIGLPHCLQKAVAKLLACGRSKRVTDSSTRSQRKADALTITSQEWAVPVALRQREQWQFRKRSKGPSTSNTTSPQMQLPRCATIPHLQPTEGLDSRSHVSRHDGTWALFRHGAM